MAAGLGVVILAYGPEPVYAPLLRSLLEAGVPAAAVTVVHNPSRAGESLPGPLPPDVDVLQQERNLGYAGGMNAGVGRRLAAGAERVLLLTHDVRFAAGDLRSLLDAATLASGFEILAPALYWEGRSFAFGGSIDSSGLASLRKELGGGTAEIVEADWAEGSALLVAAGVFARAGLFDERLFMYFEEVDLCRRATRAGCRIGIVVGAHAEQRPGFEQRPATYSYLMTRNGLELARRTAGAAGVAHGTGRAAAAAFGQLRVWVGRRSNRVQRRRGRAHLVGTVLGVAAFALRRWGPPPAFLVARDAAVQPG